VRRTRLLLVTLHLAAQALPAFAQQPAPAAAEPPLPSSPLIWEIRDGSHPKLGPIRVAVPSTSIITPVGKERILSLVFFSCERSKGQVAIELANAAESDTKGGLYPKQMPRLFCDPRSTAPRTEIASTWFVSELGDALARGFAPSVFRRCAAIEIIQDLALPRGWSAETKHIEIELIPYKKEIDEVLATCAEGPLLSAQAPAPAIAPPKAGATPAPAPPRTAAAPPAAAKPAPATPPVSIASGEAPWRSAHALTQARSNVRSAPSIDSPVVTMLEAGAAVLVQPVGADWFRVRTHLTHPPLGYIRQDRLTFP
jgi:hypothetical protein